MTPVDGDGGEGVLVGVDEARYVRVVGPWLRRCPERGHRQQAGVLAPAELNLIYDVSRKRRTSSPTGNSRSRSAGESVRGQVIAGDVGDELDCAAGVVVQVDLAVGSDWGDDQVRHRLAGDEVQAGGGR